MHAEGFLLQVRRIDAEIRRQESIIEEIRRSLEPQAIRYDREKVQSTPTDHVQSVMVRVLEKSKRIEELKRTRASVMLEIDRVLERIEDPDERTVLTHWYIMDETENKTSEAVPCSVRTMYTLKASGLRHVEDLLSG